MILRRLVIENFRQFKGSSQVDFAPPGDRSVTVLLGDNGSGKTTLLNAILWCLYGKIELENPQEILSYSAASEAEVGSQLPVEVTLTFSHQDIRYVASRRAVFRKNDGGNVVQEIASLLRLDQVRSNGEQTEVADARRAIERLLPNGLSQFFLFRGEDMESLALQTSAEKLKKGVEQFFDFTLLDSADHHLLKVIEDYEKEIDLVAIGEIKELTEKIQSLKQDEIEISNRIDEIDKNIRSVVRQKDEIDKALEEIEETRPYLEKKKILDERITRIELEHVERVSDVKSAMSYNAFLWPISDVFEVTERLAEGANQRGELPARIKPAFVDDRLELGKCICGQEIDDAMRGHLVNWKQSTGLANLEETINDCRNAIQDYRCRRDESLVAFEGMRQKLSQTESSLTQAVGERSKVESELEGKDFGIHDVKKLQDRRRSFETDIIAQNIEKARKKDVRERKVDELEKLNERRKDLAKGEEQVETLQRRRDATDSVRKAIIEIRQEWSVLIREYLDKELRHNWKEIAQLERLVEIREDFALSIKERGSDGDWVTSAPSSANLKALSLCFVSAIITLARELGSNGKSSRLKIFDGGSFPLVMDAPFAKMDTYFKRTVPNGLRRCVPQIVLISSYDQWTGEVEESLKASTGLAYILELHRPGDPDHGSTIDFDNSEVDYVVAGSNTKSDWSIVRGI